MNPKAKGYLLGAVAAASYGMNLYGSTVCPAKALTTRPKGNHSI